MTTVLVCAAFAAHAVAALVEARHLDPLPAAPLGPPRDQPAPVVTKSVPDGSALVERNMFCSTCTPAVATGGPGPTDAFVPAAELIATSIGGRSPIATIRVPASEVQGDFTVGDRLPGIGTITRVGFSTIDLVDTEGRTGTLSLLGGRSDLGAATPAEPAAASAPAHPFGDRIRKIDATTFEADRSVVRELMTSNGKNAGARILPVNKGGKLDGLRLIGVRPNMLASSLGLANGDVLQAINNTKIEDANSLLELYAQLDKLDTVTFDGLRKGKPLTLTLRLR